MKKYAIVQIEIDTDANPQPSSTSKMEGSIDGAPAWMYDIKVYPDELANERARSLSTAKTALVHELGHVVGHILETPANSNDPRSKPVGNRWTDEPANAVIASEREAWDIGREIFPGLDEGDAKRSLATYEEQSEALDSQLKISMLLEALTNY